MIIDRFWVLRTIGLISEETLFPREILISVLEVYWQCGNCHMRLFSVVDFFVYINMFLLFHIYMSIFHKIFCQCRLYVIVFFFLSTFCFFMCSMISAFLSDHFIDYTFRDCNCRCCLLVLILLTFYVITHFQVILLTKPI